MQQINEWERNDFDNERCRPINWSWTNWDGDCSKSRGWGKIVADVRTENANVMAKILVETGFGTEPKVYKGE